MAWYLGRKVQVQMQGYGFYSFEFGARRPGLGVQSSWASGFQAVPLCVTVFILGNLFSICLHLSRPFIVGAKGLL